MSDGIVRRITGTLLLLKLSLTVVFSQDAEEHSARIMFYNVENLFDIYDDTTTDDNEFLPGGVRRWNHTRYTSKISNLYKTIVAAGEWSPPAIVAFCEVENRGVLEDLVYGTYLSKYNYNIIHNDSPDPRGIDVCLIYRNDLADMINFRYLLPEAEEGGLIPTRSVLYFKWLVSGDTIHLFVNHWPSRRGGVLAGESLRLKIAGMVRNMADSIALAENGYSRIIIMGDLNTTPDDQLIDSITVNYSSGISMINLSESSARGTGTYRYRGTWEMIDQIIVSEWLLEGSNGVYTQPGLFRIFKPDFLLKNDPVYPGLSPHSTWVGYRYNAGYSDHLPVLLDLLFR